MDEKLTAEDHLKRLVAIEPIYESSLGDECCMYCSGHYGDKNSFIHADCPWCDASKYIAEQERIEIDNEANRRWY